MRKKTVFCTLLASLLITPICLLSQTHKSAKNVGEQELFYYTFEPGEYYENLEDPSDTKHLNTYQYIEFDTTAIWQIGQPHKANWDSAHSGNYVLMSDTLNMLNQPTTASFTFKFERPWYSNCIMSWALNMSDLYDLPINKAGINVEVSYNHGEKWLELNEFSTDTIGQIQVTSGVKEDWGDGYVLVGRDMGLDKEAAKISSVWLKFNYYNTDTISHKGWMIDDLGILISHGCEFLGINVNEKGSQIATLYPNPVLGQSVITFENSSWQEWQLNVYNLMGKLVLSEQTCNDYFLVNKTNFAKGSYVYQLTSNGQAMATGKFLVE